MKSLLSASYNGVPISLMLKWFLQWQEFWSLHCIFKIWGWQNRSFDHGFWQLLFKDVCWVKDWIWWLQIRIFFIIEFRNVLWLILQSPNLSYHQGQYRYHEILCSLSVRYKWKDYFVSDPSACNSEYSLETQLVSIGFESVEDDLLIWCEVDVVFRFFHFYVII